MPSTPLGSGSDAGSMAGSLGITDIDAKPGTPQPYTIRAHPKEYKRFCDQANASIRANTLMVQKFKSGKDGKRQAFLLFMEACFHTYATHAIGSLCFMLQVIHSHLLLSCDRLHVLY